MRALILVVLAVLLVGCGAAAGEGRNIDEQPLAGGFAGALAVPDETGGAASATGGADASGGVLVASGGEQATGGTSSTGGASGGSSSGGTGGAVGGAETGGTGGAAPSGGSSSGGATGGSGGGPVCAYEPVDNCAANADATNLGYFADPECTVQLFPTAQPLAMQGLIGCDKALTDEGIRAVRAWKLGSAFVSTSWWRLTANGCELTTENKPAQYGYPHFYIGEAVGIENATRDQWTCE